MLIAILIYAIYSNLSRPARPGSPGQIVFWLGVWAVHGLMAAGRLYVLSADQPASSPAGKAMPWASSFISGT